MGLAVLHFDQIPLKDNIGWNVLSFDQNSLKKLYEFSCIVFWSKFP